MSQFNQNVATTGAYGLNRLRAKRLLIGLAVLALHGCGAFLGAKPEVAAPVLGTMPPGVEAKPAPPVAVKPAVQPLTKPITPAPTTTAKLKPPPRNTGRFFQSDGPGDIAPEELANTPDPQPRDEPLARFANQRYVVFGRAYTPQTERQATREVGFASWYGRQFHGRKTATGDKYDMYSMTAAHPTLPLPSYVRVTNIANKRSVVVRVNDRGPFLNGRIIDLSYAAAVKLGYAQQGSARVVVETLLPAGPLEQNPDLTIAAAPRVTEGRYTVAIGDVGTGLRLNE